MNKLELLKKHPKLLATFALKKTQKEIKNEFGSLETLLKETIFKKFEEAKDEIQNEIQELLNGIKKGNDGHTPTNEELLTIIKPLIPEVEDGRTPTAEELLAIIKPLIPEAKNGETPSDELLISLIKPLIPEPIKGKDGIEIKPDEVIDKIEESKKKISKEKIDGLIDLFHTLNRNITELKGRIAKAKGGGGMGQPQHETFAVGGSTTSSALAYNVAASGNAIWIYYEGQHLHKGTHYTISGKTITWLVTFDDNTNVDVTYIR